MFQSYGTLVLSSISDRSGVDVPPAWQGEADVTVDHITRMNIQQFRHFISNLKVAGGGFGAEKADESFAAMAPLCRVRLIWTEDRPPPCLYLRPHPNVHE